jgi:ribosomal-protein-alanine N-acetyltransferase
MDFILRPARLADLDPIMAIETSTFGSDAWSTPLMRGELVSKHTTYLAATSSDHLTELAGYAGMLAPAGSGNADIQTIAVAPFARRNGLGRMLMLALVAEARMRGAAYVFLEVRADNPNARALYDELGFEQIAVRSQYYQPDGVDAHVMRLAL